MIGVGFKKLGCTPPPPPPPQGQEEGLGTEYSTVRFNIARVFSDILVGFLYFDISGKYQNIEMPLKVPQHTLANLTTFCPSYSRQASCLF